MRPDNWKQPESYCKLANVECIPKLSAYEAGADALWKSVCDYIAELSNNEKDDKMFRVKLFLWLTKEER